MIRILMLLKKSWIGVAIAVIFIFAQSMFDLFLPKLMSSIIDKGILTNDVQIIWQIGAQMIIVTLLGTISTIIASFLLSRVGSGLAQKIRSKVFRKVTYFSNEELNQVGTASLITRTTNDVTQIQQFVVMSRMMIAAPIMMIGGIIMANNQAPTLSWIIVVIIVSVVLIMGLLMMFIVPLFKKIQKRLDKLNLVLREFLTGMRVIRAFNRSGHEEKRFKKANQRLTDTSLKMNRLMSVLFPAMMLVMNVSMVAIIWFGGFRVEAGEVEIGSLMAFLQYAMQILFSVLMFAMIFFLLPRAQVSAKRINKVLNSTSKVENPPQGVTDFKKTEGVLEFRNVSFRYGNAENTVLSGISFKTIPGQTTAIIGGTGSGKSTLVGLIPRFYDPEAGEILIDEVPIKEMDLKVLREKIGFVSQEAVLFSGTIEENIRYGKTDATEEEVLRAATVGQCLEFIEGKEDGLQTVVSQGGGNLSGGQKQRLAIARALVRKPEIYVFDDSFSALDFTTDAKLREALKEETKNATMIVVAQRVSTIMNAEQILVLDNGKIVGKGTHSELYQNNEVYREIVLSQLSEEEAA